ncbi:hypothetical protein GBAR_LOCUS18489, partial [Geodia barretti]
MISTPTCYVWRQAMSASQSPSLLERATLALRLSPSSDRPSLVSSRNITMSTVKIVVYGGKLQMTVTTRAVYYDSVFDPFCSDIQHFKV